MSLPRKPLGRLQPCRGQSQTAWQGGPSRLKAGNGRLCMRAKTKESRVSWHRAMVWNERAVHDKILRSRPAHPQGMPRVIKFDISARDHDVSDDIIVGFGIGDFGPKYVPGRMVASTAELPSTAETPAPFHPVDQALRRQRPSNEIVSITFVDFSLTFFRKPADDEVVSHTDHQHPACCRAHIAG